MYCHFYGCYGLQNGKGNYCFCVLHNTEDEYLHFKSLSMGQGLFGACKTLGGALSVK